MGVWAKLSPPDMPIHLLRGWRSQHAPRARVDSERPVAPEPVHHGAHRLERGQCLRRAGEGIVVQDDQIRQEARGEAAKN